MQDIELHIESGSDGIIKIVDQDGRRVLGVRSIDVSCSYDDITVINAEILQRVDGKPMTNMKKK